MPLSRNQTLALKRSMDIDYLKHFDPDVQNSAYEIYHELHALKELNQIDLPITLLTKISEVLNTLNEEILKINDLQTKAQNLTELLQKEVQQKTFFEGKYNQERDNNTVISNQADIDEKKFKEQEAQHTYEIVRLKQLSLKWKVENDDMQTEQDKLTTEIENMKMKIKHLEGRNKIQDGQGIRPAEHCEKLKKVTVLEEELLNATPTDASSFAEIPTPPQLSTMPSTSTEPQMDLININSSNISINKNPESDSKNRLFVIGDSHCRYLQPELRKYAHPQCRINCVPLPGRKLHQIVSALKPEKLTPQTNICIIAGTNDVFESTYENMIKSYDLLHKKCKNFKVFIVLIPPRYDIKRISSHILNLNCKIKHYLSKYPNFTCIDPKNFLNIYSYSDDCVHLNQKGIMILCKSIIGKIYNKIHNKVDNKTRDSAAHASTGTWHTRVTPHNYNTGSNNRHQSNYNHTQRQPYQPFIKQNITRHHTLGTAAQMPPPPLMQTLIPPPFIHPTMFPPLIHPSMIQQNKTYHSYPDYFNMQHSYRDSLSRRNFLRH
uniref:Uncharacterized protein n=1 Tax=Cacopsylla melanoneura TaxID=428564 RepID=A0A8D8TLP8_9HEMI